MRILSRYFVTRFLGLFALTLVAALFVLGAIELVLNLDDVASASSPNSTGSGAADDAASALTRAAGALRGLGLRLVTRYLADLLPFASFVAAFVAFALAGRTREMLALQAGGVRPSRVVAPVLATALILSFATALLHETLILGAERDRSRAQPTEIRAAEFRDQAFWVQRGPMIAKFGRLDREGHALTDIEIFERSRRGGVVRVIRAPRGTFSDAGRWRVEDARVWHFDPLDPDRRPRLEDGVTLELDLAALDASELEGLDPGLLPIAALAAYLRGEPTEHPSSLRRLHARLHDRLASPWLVLLFAWLATPFALRVDERGRIAGPAIAAIVLLSAFVVTRSAAVTLAQEELLPVGLPIWSAMALFTALGAIAFRRRAR